MQLVYDYKNASNYQNYDERQNYNNEGNCRFFYKKFIIF